MARFPGLVLARCEKMVAGGDGRDGRLVGRAFFEQEKRVRGGRG